jgi:hypothetical protein
MAHFSQLDQSNTVINLTKINNENLLDENGIESEIVGIDFCKKIFGENTTWIQTSYNAKIRKNHPGVGYTYDHSRDAFIPPKPNFPSWTLDETTCRWEAPIPYPTDGKRYQWDETNKTWKDTTPPSPFPSWTFNNGKWNPPVPYPTDGKRYQWDEKTLSWAPIVPILDGKPPEVI